MKASIVEMEGLLRGKCVPAKMLVNESLAEYLVRQFDSLHERAEVAERERDELRLEIARIGGAKSIEVLQRDAAAGEPVSWPEMPFSFEELEGMHGATFANGYVRGWARKCESVTMKGRLYTAAPPAVLPELEQDVKNIIGLLSENEWAEHCTKSELGRKLEGEITRLHDLRAQPQKVVELPEPVKWPEIPFKYFSEEQVFSMLDSAGVKWEVKK